MTDASKNDISSNDEWGSWGYNVTPLCLSWIDISAVGLLDIRKKDPSGQGACIDPSGGIICIAETGWTSDYSYTVLTIGAILWVIGLLVSLKWWGVGLIIGILSSFGIGYWIYAFSSEKTIDENCNSGKKLTDLSGVKLKQQQCYNYLIFDSACVKNKNTKDAKLDSGYSKTYYTQMIVYIIVLIVVNVIAFLLTKIVNNKINSKKQPLVQLTQQPAQPMMMTQQQPAQPVYQQSTQINPIPQQQPMMMTQQPMMMTQQPMMMTQQPMMMTQQPMMMTQQPMMMTQQQPAQPVYQQPAQPVSGQR